MYRITTLDNGLRVASELLPGVESVAVTVTANVGARYETETENGLSHLLEHMAFKGTRTRSAKDIAEAFDNVGGQVNAYTSMELTVYYAKVLKDDMRLAVDILGDIMKNSIFDKAELEREKDVIIQEIGMHYDTPDDLIMDYFDETAFPGQSLGRSILGSEKQVASYTRDDLIAYMDKHYKPESLVVSAAGNVNHESFVALVKEYFDLPARKPGPRFEQATYHGGDARVKRDLEQLHLIMGWPAVTMHSPEHYVLQIYSNILGGGMSSRLFQEVREKRGLAYTIYSMGSAYEDCGVLSIYAATAPQRARDLSTVLCDQVASMADAITDTELARAKTQLKAELLMTRESPQSVANWIGRHLSMYKEYRDASNIAGRIDAITKKDLLALGEKIAGGKLTVAGLGDISHIEPYDTLAARLQG